MNPIRNTLVAVSAALLVGASGATFAQPAGPASPRVEGFDIEQVQQLTPGTDLNFTVWGTPGGTATLRIAGARRPLVLEESHVGVYEGSYTISARDRITPDSRVTANLRQGNQVASAALDEPILASPPSRANPSGAEPRVERFEVQPAASVEPGNEVSFTLRGTPGGQATVAIDGARGKFFLPENRPGEYSGSYMIRNGDRITPDSTVLATLRVGGGATTTALGRPLAGRDVRSARGGDRERERDRDRRCIECGTVSAINPIEVKGDGNYLGAIGGGVVGALLGSQVGGGDGRTAAQIAGAVGGAYAGREIQRNTRRTTHYEVVVQLQNGGSQTVSYASEPEFHVGDRVRVVDGALVRNNP